MAHTIKHKKKDNHLFFCNCDPQNDVRAPFAYIRGKGGKKLLLLRTFFVRHSDAGQPSERSGNRMVAEGKTKEKC